MNFGAISFKVNNMKKMVEFYQKAFDIDLKWDGGDFCGCKMQDKIFFNLFHDDEVIIARDKDGINNTMQITLEAGNCDEQDKLFNKFIDLGANVLMRQICQPYGLRECMVADPEGNIIEIVAAI